MPLLPALLLTTALPVAAVQSDLEPRPRPVVATLEGPLSPTAVGLYDARTGSFQPRWIDGAVAQLRDLEVLAIDHVGRSELTARSPHTPRLRTDVGGASRLELPRGQGSLFRFRATAAGQIVFGFLHVDRGGVPRVALERPALIGGGDPFLPRVAVDTDGTGVLVATVRAAGGDLVELDLARRTSIVRTEGTPPLVFGRDGLWLGPDWGFGVARDGVRRFSRGSSTPADLVPVQGGGPLGWRGDAAMSPSRSAAVAVGGVGASGLVPYVFGSTGSARPATAQAAKIAPAGYAPESTFGPFLAVSDDGATCAWCVELVDATNQPFRDVVVGRAGAAFGEVAVTGDALVTDTLDEVARLFFRLGELVFAVGEGNDPTEGGLESADVFGATLGVGGSPNVRNVSATSGQTSAPFTSIPAWTPAFYGLVTDDAALIHEDDDRKLVALDLASGTFSVVLPDVREVLWLEAAGPGGAWCAAVERDTPGREMQIVGAPSPMAPAQVLDGGTPSTVYHSPVASRAPTGAVGYVRTDAGLDRVQVTLPAAGRTLVWSPTASSVTPPLAFVGPRRLAFTRQAGPGGDEQRVWRFLVGADLVLEAPVRPSFILR